MDAFKEKFHKLLMQGRHNFGGSHQTVPAIVDEILNFAVNIRASDIHFEPVESFLRVRYRVDGHLLELHEPIPKELSGVITSRIKILASMDTTTIFLPLDGAIRKDGLDMRVAVMPSRGADSVTIRLMNSAATLQKISDLGFTPKNEKIFRQEIAKTSGMIILTGPMNSGKSTTLYAALRELNQPSRSIMTLEDPIEQVIEGVSQVSVNEKQGLTFAAGLRAMLRMDCNCLMVGEVRDKETAQIAVRAALTGHLVFTTLHASESCSALFRMIEMGVEPYLLASVLKCVVAQRLVRRLCPHCKELKVANEIERELIGAEEIFQPVGCAECNGTGYLGRLALHEVLRVGKSLRDVILNERDLDKIRAVALNAGLETLRADGVAKIRAGLTTLEEVRSVLGEDFVQ